jgi:enterochelin esterase-like enzyme
VTWFEHVSLLGGWFPPFVAAAAWAALVFGVAWWRRAWWHWIVIAAAATVTTAFVAWLVDIPAMVGSTFPASFMVWVGLPLFAVGAVVWQWPHVRLGRRVVAVASVPLLIVFAALQINGHYFYLPTVGDVVGAKLAGEVSVHDLTSTGPKAFGHRSSRGVLRGASIGAIAQVTIPGTRSRFHARAGYVWLPPAWFTSPRPVLPVLMLLAGTPGSPGDWFRGGHALTIANHWAAAHHGFAPVIVSPDINGSLTGDTECVGAVDSYLTIDVRQYVHDHFDVSLSPHWWAVAGLSEGGTCALDLVARHPDLFRTFGDFSGEQAPSIGPYSTTLRHLFSGSVVEMHAYDPRTWFSVDATNGVAGFVSVGTADPGYIPQEQRIVTAAHAAGIPVTYDPIPGGGHNWSTDSRALQDAYTWIVERLENQNPSTPPLLPRPDATTVTAHTRTHYRTHLRRPSP